MPVFRTVEANAALRRREIGMRAPLPSTATSAPARFRANSRTPSSRTSAHLQDLERLAVNVAALAGPQSNIIAGGFDPVDVADVEHRDAPRCRDDDPLVSNPSIPGI